MKISSLAAKSTEQVVLKPVIAADHGEFELKTFLVEKRQDAGYGVIDFGDSVLKEDDHYPDYVFPLAGATAAGQRYWLDNLTRKRNSQW